MDVTDRMAAFSEFTEQIDVNSKARTRLKDLFDPDSFVELSGFMKTQERETGVVAGYGLIEGSQVYAYAQDAAVDSGAVSHMHAQKIEKVYELAAKTGCPVVSLLDSNGAKLSEGTDMLAAYSKILLWSNRLSGVVPQIAVVLGTCAGVSALLAASADFVLMDKAGELFMTAPFLTKAAGDTTASAGSAENAAKGGVASAVFDTQEDTLAAARRLLAFLPQNNLAVAPLFDYGEENRPADPTGAAKDVVQAVADTDSLFELYQGYGEGIETFLGTLGGTVTAFAATSRDIPIDAASAAKAVRLVKTADAFNIPIVTFVDSAGFAVTADVSLVREIARLASAYAEATTQKISVITGKAFGSVYVALGSKNAAADLSVDWPTAQISALNPDAAVEFLWSGRLASAGKDAKSAHETLVLEYSKTEASPFQAAQRGHLDSIIAPDQTRSALIGMMDMLAGKRESKLPKKHVTL